MRGLVDYGDVFGGLHLGPAVLVRDRIALVERLVTIRGLSNGIRADSEMNLYTPNAEESLTAGLG